MIAIQVFVVVYASLSLMYWLWMAYGSIRLVQTVPLLADLKPPEPGRWPRLSVIVPACNEADKLEAAAQTLLDEDYPELEIVLVNDRSSDQTGQIVERLAAQDKRVRTIHIKELPEGWLGKVNAMQRGLAECNGEFVLFTDADVHFAKGTLRKAVGYCLEKQLDHLAGLPERWPTGLVLDSVISIFLRVFFIMMARPWAANKRTSRVYLGVGAFNMVRRSAFEATEGFQWLRQEVADDMGLGLLMKRSGAKCRCVAAFGNVGLHWYSSLAEAKLGAEKAHATLSNFRLGQTLAITLFTLIMEISPVVLLAGLFFDKLRFVGYGGIVIFAGYVFSVVTVSRWAKARILPNLLSPLTIWLMAVVFIRAGLLGWWRGGVNWRGTLYQDRKFRDGKRVHFP